MGEYYKVVIAFQCNNCGQIYDNRDEARHCCD